MHCLQHFGDSNKLEIVALFTRFEPVQFLLAGMLKGKLYSYSPHMEDGMKERIQDVVLSSAAPPELQCANNNMLRC
jgi:hypothetical protein